ncbi:MAG TPA: M20/M25/M40 family metallo-hydrolase [Ktedonobacteraceae bacterium]|nr:M20/M25/M40 family metallo-hydrolase [Ktedonobacteraceae bacterium]
MSSTSLDLERLRTAAQAHVEAIASLAWRICEVPAPTGQEFERARFVATLWQERGYTPEIDAVGNVYVRRAGKDPHAPVLLLLAHTDTVFPASTPLEIRREGDTLHGPGISDNSVSVASMLHTFDLLDELHLETATDVIAVANVGEEGLGNLLGARTAVERYRSRLGAVLVIDGGLGYITHGAVGSQRWRVTVSGPGGHSYGSFGTPSAIHGLGRIIASLADMQVPQKPKTTFNVGVIEGGTSINTIAAEASALLDMRSTDVECLKQLAEEARTRIEQSAGAGLTTTITVLGERPAGERSIHDPLVQLAARTLQWLGLEVHYGSSSTDANIPISLNIPAVCIGVTHGENAHTLQEFFHISPLGQGLAQVGRLTVEASDMLAV